MAIVTCCAAFFRCLLLVKTTPSVISATFAEHAVLAGGARGAAFLLSEQLTGAAAGADALLLRLKP